MCSVRRVAAGAAGEAGGLVAGAGDADAGDGSAEGEACAGRGREGKGWPPGGRGEAGGGRGVAGAAARGSDPAHPAQPWPLHTGAFLVLHPHGVGAYARQTTPTTVWINIPFFFIPFCFLFSLLNKF